MNPVLISAPSEEAIKEMVGKIPSNNGSFSAVASKFTPIQKIAQLPQGTSELKNEKPTEPEEPEEPENENPEQNDTPTD